jgi:hypothetical protein
MLKPTRDGGRLVGLSGTRTGPLLPNSIQVRKAGDEHEQAPGFVEADLVLHCGATFQGEFVHSLTVTDVFTGWRREHGTQGRHPPVGDRACQVFCVSGHGGGLVEVGVDSFWVGHGEYS